MLQFMKGGWRSGELNAAARLHLVFTGRGVPPEIIARTDLVTERKEIKHHYARGIKAQAGVEF